MTSRNKKESEMGIFSSGEKCVICGWNGIDNKGNSLVEGAHVKPIEFDKSCDKAENIIALCPNHHTEFDRYVFTIDTKTRKIISIYDDYPYNGLSIKSSINHIKDEYLSYRQYLYNKENNLD